MATTVDDATKMVLIRSIMARTLELRLVEDNDGPTLDGVVEKMRVSKFLGWGVYARGFCG